MRAECFLDFKNECDDPMTTNVRRKLINPIIETVMQGHNVSYVVKEFSGNSEEESTSKSVDECLLSLKNNESDIVVMAYSMPVFIENIKTGPVFDEVKIGILSVYDIDSGGSRHHTAIDSFKSFSTESVLLLFLFLLMFYMLIRMSSWLKSQGRKKRKKKKKRKNNTLFMIYSHFVHNPQVWTGYSTTSINMLVTLLVFFSFWITFYFSASIKTEAITVIPAKVIKSYQNILDNEKVNPMFLRFFDEYFSFKFADESSVKRKVWKRVNEKGTENCIFGFDDISRFIKLMDSVKSQKGALVMFDDLIYAFRYFILSLLRESKLRSYFVYDPIEQAHVRTLLFNHEISKKSEKVFNRRMSLVRESGFKKNLFENLATTSLDIYVEFMSSDKPSRDISPIGEYFSTRVLLSDSVVTTPGLDYLKGIYALVSGLFLLSLFLLFFEIMIERMSRKILPELLIQTQRIFSD